MRKRLWIPAAVLAVAAFGFFGVAPGYLEASMNRVDGKERIKVSPEAEALHQSLCPAPGDYRDFKVFRGYVEPSTWRTDPAISVARWGIAETGSVVIHSAPDQPILNAMLPRHWLVALEEDRILPFLDDYAALAKPAPRNAVLITGSSGTTDIEGYFVRGAHGPGFVHVLLISQ